MRMCLSVSLVRNEDDWIICFCFFYTGTLPVFTHDFLSPTGFKLVGGGHVIANLCLPPPPSNEGISHKAYDFVRPSMMRFARALPQTRVFLLLGCFSGFSRWCNDELSLMMCQYINRP